MSDSSRLFFALVLGASATAALLAGLVPLLTPRPAGTGSHRLGAAAWLALLVAWVAGAVTLADGRGLLPWHVGAALVAALAVTQFGGPVARAVSNVSGAGALALSSLRAVGAVRLAAASVGWLPQGYATTTAAVDIALGLAAVALAIWPSQRAVRAWAALSLVTLAAGYAWQVAQVRPLSTFEALYDAFLAPLFAVAAVAAWRGRR